MNFKREILTREFIEEAFPLFQNHYKEISKYQDIPLEPDIELYLGIENAGSLRVYTMRLEDKLVGYAIFIVRSNMHYKSSIQAHQDILFLQKDQRGSLHGYKFIEWCDNELQKEGIQVVYHHVKTAHNFGKLLERQGYEAIDIIYGKRLN